MEGRRTGLGVSTPRASRGSCACGRGGAPKDDSTYVNEKPGLARTNAGEVAATPGHDLPDIAWRDTLTVLAPYNSMTYFIYKGEPILDLDYPEDSAAGTDANFVLTGRGGIVEIQGTAEGEPFSRAELDALMKLAEKGIGELVDHQRRCLEG